MSFNTQKTEPEEVVNKLCLTATKMMTWKIATFSQLPKEADYFLDSPAFRFENALWCLRLYPNLKKNIGPDEYVGYSLKKLSSHVYHPKVGCNLMIKGKDVSVNAIAVFHFDEDEKEKKEMEIICTYFDIIRELELNVGDVLTLQFLVYCERPPVVDCFEIGVVTQETKDLQCLSRDLKDLLVNGKNHDVTLKVKGKEFHAHQNILRARSPVFSAMLTYDMVKNRGVVDIPDCDPYAFEQFLIYLYSGKLETLDASQMTALHYLADKYDVGGLKERGRPSLKTSMTSANVVEAIEFALSHSDVDLLKRATDYFVENVNNVLPTVQWQCFVKNNPKKANELFIKAVMKMSEGKS